MMEKVFVAKSMTVDADQTLICGTRYGNVMASRGSVIPLFLEQIQNGLPLTVTDPNMTRYLMTLEEAVDLVVFAFQNAKTGDIMVQKADACRVGDLAQAMKELFEVDNPIRIIGTRHGEKLYETLLTREEMVVAQDFGEFYRVPADTRDLNYDKYFVEGDQNLSTEEEYTSHHTKQLTVDQIKLKLMQLESIRTALVIWRKR
jgi:UDP-glucose 4-epimerase